MICRSTTVALRKERRCLIPHLQRTCSRSPAMSHYLQDVTSVWSDFAFKWGPTKSLWVVGADPENGGWNVLRASKTTNCSKLLFCGSGRLPSLVYRPGRPRTVLNIGIGIFPRFFLLTDGGISILFPLPPAPAAGVRASSGLPLTPSTRRRSSRGLA